MSKRTRRALARRKKGNSHADPRAEATTAAIKTAVSASNKATTTGAGAAAGTTQYSLACVHQGPRLAFKLDGTKIWAGPRSLALLHTWGLVVSCGTAFYSNTADLAPVSANIAAQELLPAPLYEFKPPPMLTLAWTDAGVPALPASYWAKLLTFLREFHQDVYFCCDGGHGRTGTALSVLYGLACKKRIDPVAAVRKLYCDEAVETTVQVNYVEDVTGLRVNVLSSYMVTHYTAGWDGERDYGLTYGTKHQEGKWDA